MTHDPTESEKLTRRATSNQTRLLLALGDAKLQLRRVIEAGEKIAADHIKDRMVKEVFLAILKDAGSVLALIVSIVPSILLK